jgi:hypothetical protein
VPSLRSIDQQMRLLAEKKAASRPSDAASLAMGILDLLH